LYAIILYQNSAGSLLEAKLLSRKPLCHRNSNAFMMCAEHVGLARVTLLGPDEYCTTTKIPFNYSISFEFSLKVALYGGVGKRIASQRFYSFRTIQLFVTQLNPKKETKRNVLSLAWFHLQVIPGCLSQNELVSGQMTRSVVSARKTQTQPNNSVTRRLRSSVRLPTIDTSMFIELPLCVQPLYICTEICSCFAGVYDTLLSVGCLDRSAP
jgi:hypothetical protein